MTDNANFATPVPALADITAARVELRTWIDKAQWGDKQFVGVRNDKAKVVADLLRQLAQYISLTANGDRDMILSSGFDVRKQPEPTVKLSRPVDFSAKRGEESGVVELKWKPVSRSKAYQVEMTTGDPREASSVWETVAITSRSNCMVNNLAEGTKYSFRVKAYSGNLKSPYSDPAIIMAA
jgi:hypothetical protein